MAAWPHTAFWTPDAYRDYRKFVRSSAASLRGRTEDCADLSILLMVEFAAGRGLPLTFVDNANVRYLSKGSVQVPVNVLSKTKRFNSKDKFYEAVSARVNAKALLNWHTIVNPDGPEAGDFMVKSDHAALVYSVYSSGARHPRSCDKNVPVFPGDQEARKQLGITEYFRDEDGQIIGPTRAIRRFDYLNHRGFGKDSAELIYFAALDDPDFKDFKFKRFNSFVLDNWQDWDGFGNPPR